MINYSQQNKALKLHIIEIQTKIVINSDEISKIAFIWIRYGHEHGKQYQLI
jgi:hypothetical protein